jgi:hypothetical protein
MQEITNNAIDYTLLPMGPLLFTRILRAAQQPMPKTPAKIILDGSGTPQRFATNR